MTQSEGEFHAREFIRRLREESVNKDDPLPEWTTPRLISLEYNQTGGHCICKKDIHQLFQIQNKNTKATLIIGADCAKRWFEAKYHCTECKIPLSNVVKRLRESNFICPTCAQKARREQKLQQLRKDALLKRHGNSWFNDQLAIPFPFEKKKKIKDHLEDQAFCDFVLNLDTVHISNVLMPMALRYYSEYLQDIQMLIRLTWDVEERL